MFIHSTPLPTPSYWDTHSELWSHTRMVCDLPYPNFMCLKWLYRSCASFEIDWFCQRFLFLHFREIFSQNLSLDILIEFILIKKRVFSLVENITDSLPSWIQSSVNLSKIIKKDISNVLYHNIGTIKMPKNASKF